MTFAAHLSTSLPFIQTFMISRSRIAECSIIGDIGRLHNTLQGVRGEGVEVFLGDGLAYNPQAEAAKPPGSEGVKGMIAKYGRREIALATVLAAVVAARAGLAACPGGVVPVAAWLAVLWFFRDPRAHRAGARKACWSPRPTGG